MTKRSRLRKRNLRRQELKLRAQEEAACVRRRALQIYEAFKDGSFRLPTIFREMEW